MKIAFKISLLASFVYLAGCSGGNTNSTPNSTEEVNMSTPAEKTPISMPQQVETGEDQQETNGSVVLNPPHGQPGHDCAVAVGAPLTSSPQNGDAVNTQTQSTPIEINASQVQGSVAEGTNPPHGQPGHDCAIPVGAPLKK